MAFRMGETSPVDLTEDQRVALDSLTSYFDGDDDGLIDKKGYFPAVTEAEKKGWFTPEQRGWFDALMVGINSLDGDLTDTITVDDFQNYIRSSPVILKDTLENAKGVTDGLAAEDSPATTDSNDGQ